MQRDAILEELLGLFVRSEIPGEVRAAIANQFGDNEYLLAKEAMLAGLSDPDAVVRDACVGVLANQWRLQEVGPKLIEMMQHDQQEFVRIEAAAGLGVLQCAEAIPALKRIIVDRQTDEVLRQTAYETLLSILGKSQDSLDIDTDNSTSIDWDLVRSL